MSSCKTDHRRHYSIAKLLHSICDIPVIIALIQKVSKLSRLQRKSVDFDLCGTFEYISKNDNTDFYLYVLIINWQLIRPTEKHFAYRHVLRESVF